MSSNSRLGWRGCTAGKGESRVRWMRAAPYWGTGAHRHIHRILPIDAAVCLGEQFGDAVHDEIRVLLKLLASHVTSLR
jgi:hypothetical protein